MSSDRDGVIRLEKFNSDAKALVAGAQQLADQSGHNEVLPVHLLSRAVERSPAMAAVLKSAGAPPAEVGEFCDKALKRLSKGGDMAFVSPRMLDLLDRAQREAKRDHESLVGLAHLLHALAQEIRGPVGEIFTHFGIVN